MAQLGEILDFDEHVNPIGHFGDWTITFTDNQTFKVAGPNGVDIGRAVTGTVGKSYHNAYGPEFTVNAGSIPFAAGDSLL